MHHRFVRTPTGFTKSAPLEGEFDVGLFTSSHHIFRPESNYFEMGIEEHANFVTNSNVLGFIPLAVGNLHAKSHPVHIRFSRSVPEKRYVCF
jgi:hypothetical protein